jgi:DNA-binding NtrC family response regulator
MRRRSAGALECAQGGTLVLENIHWLPAPLQQPLLDVLQHGAFQRSGGKETLTWQGRLVATSSRSLADVLAEGLLREDLFHVLNVAALTVPPLRERRDDIPLIADSMRDDYRQRLGVEALAIAGAANEWLSARDWPGNVLELEQTVRSGIGRLQSGQVLEIEHFQSPAEPRTAAASSLSPAEDLASMEREHILEILRRSDNNRTHAAQRLGISIRTLRNKLREYRQQAGD